VTPNPSATLAEALASAGQPAFVLDLRNLPSQGPVFRWFSAPQGSLQTGAVFSSDDGERSVIGQKISEQFDGLVYIEKTTAALRMPGDRVMAATATSCGRLRLHASHIVVRLDPSDRLPCTSWLWRPDSSSRSPYARKIRATNRPSSGCRRRRAGLCLGQSGQRWAELINEKAAGAFRSKANIQAPFSPDAIPDVNLAHSGMAPPTSPSAPHLHGQGNCRARGLRTAVARCGTTRTGGTCRRGAVARARSARGDHAGVVVLAVAPLGDRVVATAGMRCAFPPT